MRGRNEKTIRIARRLRVNQTDAETVLWNRIRNRQIDGHKFVRQVRYSVTSAISFVANDG
jgi:very-short-patch-repair endonuclease